MTASALCADVDSFAIVVREIMRAYPDGRHRDSGRDEEPLEYLQYSEWRNDVLISAEADEGTAYWAARAAEHVRNVQLPFEAGDGVGGCPTPDRVTARFGNALLSALNEHSVRDGVALRALLLAAWQGLLSRLTGQGDIVVDVRLDGRKFDELEQAVGVFSDYVPVTATLEPNDSLLGLARRMETALAEASDYQEYFNRDRRMGQGDAVAQIAFELVEWPALTEIRMPPVVVQDVTSHTGPFKLRLVCLASTTLSPPTCTSTRPASTGRRRDYGWPSSGSLGGLRRPAAHTGDAASPHRR